MVILILIILAGIVLGFLSGFDSDGVLQGIMEGFLGGLLGAFVGCLLFIPMAFLSRSLPTAEEEVSTEQIYALNDASEMNGNIYLSSGSVNEKLVYRYMVEGTLGLYVKEVKASNAYIQEGHQEAYVEHHDVSFKHWWCYLIGVEGLLKDYDVFYVPEGSVTTEYRLNLE